jgi:hypothetical protein
LGGRPYGIRERPTVSEETVGIATEVTKSLPQNGIVRSGRLSCSEYGAGQAYPKEKDMAGQQPPRNERKPNNQ